MSGSRTSPSALTATSAPTITPPSSLRLLEPIPPRIARAMPWILPTLAPVPAPTLPSATGPTRGLTGRLPAHLACGTDSAVAHVEIEQERARHVRHHRRSRRVALALALQPAQHAPDGLAAEAAAAAQHDAVHRADEVTRVEIVEADHVVGPAAQLGAGHRRPIAQHHADAREGGLIGGVADADAGDVGDRGRGVRGPVEGLGPRLAADLGGGNPAQGDFGGDLQAATRERRGRTAGASPRAARRPAPPPPPRRRTPAPAARSRGRRRPSRPGAGPSACAPRASARARRPA